MADLSPEERAKLMGKNPDGRSRAYVEVAEPPQSKKEKASGVMKGALAIGFLALVMYLGNMVTTTTAPNLALSIAAAVVVGGSILVAAAAAYYGRSPT